MREGELAHVRDIVDDIAYAMTEDGSNHGDKRDENSWPVVDVGDEEVVDMDTALGGKGKVQQEYNGQHGECHCWFEWQDGWS